MSGVTVWSHGGKNWLGTQAPPSMTISRTARIDTPRAACGVLPRAAIRSPKVAAVSA